jgi:hypothetical protein
MDGELLSDAFVELTDTMVAGFDVMAPVRARRPAGEFHRCAGPSDKAA